MRKHSKFSASGAERWMACPGSVALSEGLPDTTSVWAEEGTRAHGVLEKMLLSQVNATVFDTEMIAHAHSAAKHIWSVEDKSYGADLLVETRTSLSFIHPEAFGTLDAAVVEVFGTLHILDFKYGAGHVVSPTKNLQMIFYAMGIAHQYEWNFKNVRLWIIQPRAKGYDGPVFWEIGIDELRDYVVIFRDAINRVELNPTKYVEGSHCHWCKAKRICPLKRDAKTEKMFADL